MISFMMTINEGDTLTIIVEGKDAKEAARAIEACLLLPPPASSGEEIGYYEREALEELVSLLESGKRVDSPHTLCVEKAYLRETN